MICSGCFVREARLRRTRALDKYNKTHLCVCFVSPSPPVEREEMHRFLIDDQNEKMMMSCRENLSNILDKINDNNCGYRGYFSRLQLSINKNGNLTESTSTFDYIGGTTCGHNPLNYFYFRCSK